MFPPRTAQRAVAAAKLAVFTTALLLTRSAAQTPAAAAAFHGTWLGEVTAPQGSTAIGFAFAPAKDGAVTTATFYMPAMFLHDAPLGPARLADGGIRVPALDTLLRREGEQLVGTFGRSALPIILRRAERFPAATARAEYPAGPAPRWTTRLPAEVWSSPIVHDGMVYLGSADGQFHALDAGTGKQRWSWSGSHAIYGTAAAANRRIYILDASTTLLCLDRDTGALAWRTSLHDATRAGPLKENETFNRRTATPVAAGGVVYAASPDGALYVLDAENGAVLSRHEVGAPIYAAPDVAPREITLGAFDGSVVRLDRTTGNEIGRTNLAGPIASTPVRAGDIIVAGCRDYMLYGLRTKDLSTAWKFSYWFSWVESVPAIVEGIVYIGGSDFARITALDPATGRAHWSTAVGGLTWGTPVVTEDAVFAGTSAQASAIIPHEGGIVALDRKTGAVRWRVPSALRPGLARAGYVGSLVRSGDMVIGASFDGTVIALPIAQ